MATEQSRPSPATDSSFSPPLKRAEFEILQSLRTGVDLSQRALATQTGLSLGTINVTAKSLETAGLIQGSRLTDEGWRALEPYRVDNAVIMAAGMSTRFAPISYEKPKGLLTVKGEVLIERTIRQLQEAGISDITVVVGYKMEQFLYLEDAFDVKIVVNTEYTDRNNNSTLKAVEGILGNTYICSSDNYFTRNVFEPYVWQAYYSAVWRSGPSDEWGLVVGPWGRITKVVPGCKDSWVMMGHVYFDRRFSTKFVEILDRVYDRPETAPKLWESIYSDHIKDLDMVIRRYDDGIVYEFDTLEDLREFDPDFILNIDSTVLDNICHVLNVSRADLSGFEPIAEGLTNLSFRFTAKDKTYVYRHPGVATQGILDRQAEADAEKIAFELGLDKSFIYLDPEHGWKISQFIDVTEHFDYHNTNHVTRALRLAKTLHDCGHSISSHFNIFAEAEKIVGLLTAGAQNQRLEFPDFDLLRRRAKKLYDLAEADGVPTVLCHDDFYDPNILIKNDEMYLIDWEYSGMSDYASDLGTFICCSDYTYEEALTVFSTYFDRQPTDEEIRHCVAYVSLAAYYWWVWALHKDACGEPVGEYTYLWYRYAKEYSGKAVAMYEAAD